MKIRDFFLTACFFLFALNGVVFAQGSSEGEDNVVQPVFPDLSENDGTNLSDGKYLTTYSGDKLTITAEKKFKAIYIIWNVIPQSYTVKAGGDSEKYDGDFLHKIIKLDGDVNKAEIICSKEEEICDIYLFSDYNFPDFVQQWEPPCRQADLMVLSAHADDEYLMFGGTIPYYAKERGLQVQVVYLTSHPKEQPRPHERLDGLWLAGVKNYPVVGIIEDIPYSPIFSLEEAAKLYDFDKVLEWFTEQIRRFKPSVLVTHDLEGEYGHGAHMLAAKTAVDAVEIAGDDEKFPDSAKKYGAWDVPKTYLHLYPENSIRMDWETPLESFGGLTARDAGNKCLQCHKSQMVYDYELGDNGKWDCHPFGLYRSLVGMDSKADFMDNIDPLPPFAETSAAEETAVETTEEITEKITTAEEITTQITTASEVSSDAITTVEETTADGAEDKADNMIFIVLLLSVTAAVIVVIIVSVKYKKK